MSSSELEIQLADTRKSIRWTIDEAYKNLPEMTKIVPVDRYGFVPVIGGLSLPLHPPKETRKSWKIWRQKALDSDVSQSPEIPPVQVRIYSPFPYDAHSGKLPMHVVQMHPPKAGTDSTPSITAVLNESDAYFTVPGIGKMPDKLADYKNLQSILDQTAFSPAIGELAVQSLATLGHVLSDDALLYLA